MRARNLAALSGLVAALVLPSSAAAMLPATESGFRPAHPSDCTWRCVKKKVPTTFDRVRAAQQELVNADLDASRRMQRLSQQLKQMEMQLALQEQMLEKLAEATETVVRNTR